MQTRRVRSTIVLCCLYGALMGGWLGLARSQVPSFLAATGPGPHLPLLDSLVQTWKVMLPNASPQQGWLEFSTAVAIGLFFHLVIVLFSRALDSQPTRQTPTDRQGNRWASTAALGLALAFLAYTVGRGAIQDYFLVLSVWHEVLVDHDPWFLVPGPWGHCPMNAYGPLFNLLAIPAGINLLLPKLLFALAYLLFAIRVMKHMEREPRPPGWCRFLLLFWLFGPFPWIEIAHYGHFDILVGLLCVTAVEARVRGRDLGCGVSLGMGCLLKFLPVVLLPFLAIEQRKVRYRLALAATATIILGFGASLFLWGWSTLRPLLFAAGRRSEHLSVFRFLKGSYSPLGWFGNHENLDQWAMPILLAALLITWSRTQKNATGPFASSAAALLVLLLFYQVGFPQYQMVVFVLMTYWAVKYRETLPNGAALWIAMVFYFGWYSAYDIIISAGDLSGSMMMEWAGLVTFLLGCALLNCIARSEPAIRQFAWISWLKNASPRRSSSPS